MTGGILWMTSSMRNHRKDSIKTEKSTHFIKTYYNGYFYFFRWNCCLMVEYNLKGSMVIGKY